MTAIGRAPTFFWSLFARLGGLFGIRQAAFLLWFGVRVAGGYATYRTARILGAGRKGAVLALALVFCSRHLFLSSALAGDPLFKSDLDQTSFVWPLALAAAAAWLAGRKPAREAAPWLPAAGLGLLANLNPLVAGLTFLWLSLGELLRDWRAFRSMATAGACFLAGMLPLLLRWLSSPPVGDPSLMADCAPLTYLASSWPAERWLSAAGALTLTAAAFRRHPDSGRLLPLLGAAMLLWGIQVFLGPFFPLFLAAQFFRLDVLVVWLGLIAAAVVLAERLKGDSSAQDLTALAAVWGAACASLSPLLALWAATLLWRERAPRWLLWTGAVIGSAGSLVPGYWFPLALPPSAAAITILLSVFTAIAADLESLSLKTAGSRPALPLLMVFAVFPMTGAVAGNLRDAVTACRDRTPEAFDLWVRTTPKETLFAAHPASSGLRLRARRPVYAEWNDFALGLWDRAAAAAWKTRMESLGLRWEDFRERHAAQERSWDRAYLRGLPSPEASDFPQWSPDDARRLSGVGGSAFLVLPRSLAIGRVPAFQDAGLAVYR